ncbi:hypothetical protein BSKO_13380 [Bryopsis sp. KO-2023]|nr:hypothetical protein BSKO_13380 [Bryopsis sp. KO-2023]
MKGAQQPISSQGSAIILPRRFKFARFRGVGQSMRPSRTVATALATVSDVTSYQGVKVGFQGKSGAYSEIACQKAFPGCDACPCKTFDDAFKALAENEVNQALLPMENSTGGTVHDVYLLLPKYGLHIVGEYSLGVEHCLLGPPGSKISDIRKVTSHWQALAQCTQFCERMGFQMEQHEDTAGAAYDVSQNKWGDVAAIASTRAADIYGLQILEKGIQNNDLNYTRFVGLSTSPIDPPKDLAAEECKTTIMFACRDGAGGLQMLLAKLLALDINLEKIEPQAMVDDPLIDKKTGRSFNYLFIADFAGSIADDPFQKAFELFEEYTGFYRVLGSYQRHVF